MKTYEIGLLQTAAHRALYEHTSTFLHEFNISPNQWAVLGLAEKKDDLRLTGIADELHMRPASASEIIEDLVQKNYLTRTQNTDDRRVKDITLTEMGQEFVSSTEPKLKAHMQPLLSDTSAQEISGYLQTLQKIAKAHG